MPLITAGSSKLGAPATHGQYHHRLSVTSRSLSSVLCWSALPYSHVKFRLGKF